MSSSRESSSSDGGLNYIVDGGKIVNSVSGRSRTISDGDGAPLVKKPTSTKRSWSSDVSHFVYLHPPHHEQPAAARCSYLLDLGDIRCT